MSESYPIRALARFNGLPYSDLLMVSDFLAEAHKRHGRPNRGCELVAYARVTSKLSLTGWTRLKAKLTQIELKAQGRLA